MQTRAQSEIFATVPVLRSGMVRRPVNQMPLIVSRRMPEVSSLVRLAFAAFVFSILFEEIPIGIPVESTQITGSLLVFAVLLLQPRTLLQRVPGALWCFIIYFILGIAILLTNDSFFDDEVLSRQFKFIQLLVLFWISYVLMRDERVAREALLSLIASCLLLSLLQIFGLTITTEFADSRLARFTAFGLDSNHLAGVLSLGLLAAVGFAYEKKRHKTLLLPLVIPVCAFIGITIVKTGSRGGLLALAFGLLVLLLAKGSLSSKVRNIFVGVSLFAFFGWIAYQSEIVKGRFQHSWEDGSLSGREQIYPMAWQMFLEKPLAGWGPVTNSVELGNRLQLYGYDRMDPHNLVLYVLTATGLVGALPFLTGIFLCVRTAWRSRIGPHGIIAFALTVSLLTAELSVTGFHWKHHWIILAYALATGAYLNGFRGKPVLITLTGHSRSVSS